MNMFSHIKKYEFTLRARFCRAHSWHGRSHVLGRTFVHSVAPTECTNGTVTLCVCPSRERQLQNFHRGRAPRRSVDSLKSNLRMRAKSTSSRPGRCTAMIVETLPGLGVIAPACRCCRTLGAVTVEQA